MRVITTYLLILICAFAYGQDPAADTSPEFIFKLSFGDNSAKKEKDKELNGVCVKWIKDSTKEDSILVSGSNYNLKLELNHEYTIYLTKQGYQGYMMAVNTTISSDHLDEDGNTGSTLHANFIKLDEVLDGNQIEDLGIIDFTELSKEIDTTR